MPAIEKVCFVVKETPLEGLVKRYGTPSQAKFVLRQQSVSFEPYEQFDHAYHSALDTMRHNLPPGLRAAVVEFKYLPTYQFDPNSAVITVGPDGLVANTAKYLDQQPLIAVNPDPSTIDGVLARNSIHEALMLLRNPPAAFEELLAMARARLHDGQELLAVNDLFIGQRTHVSARYQLSIGGAFEQQSSSGIIVSTGAGSTGWHRSIVTGAAGVAAAESGSPDLVHMADNYAFSPSARRLAFAVREPFVSRASGAGIIAGAIEDGQELVITSQMPQNGVIFSDGVEADFLEFNSGAIAHVGLAKKTVRLWSVRRLQPRAQPVRHARVRTAR